MMATRLLPKDPVEVIPVLWDFSQYIGESPVSATVVEVSCELHEGLSPDDLGSPSDLTLEGAPWFDGAVLKQMVSGGVSGAFYRVWATVQVDASPVEIHKLSVVLPVI